MEITTTITREIALVKCLAVNWQKCKKWREKKKTEKPETQKETIVKLTHSHSLEER